MQVYWLAFSDSRGEGFPTLSCAATDFGARMIRVQSGFSSEKLIAWLKLLRPDVVHHQGPLRIQVMRVCNALKIPFITGFHFWSGAIELNPSFGNVDILQHAEAHEKSPELDDVLQNADMTYVASEFMQQVLTRICKVSIPVLNPISGKDECFVSGMQPWHNLYVTCLNIHRLKGGRIVLNLMRDLPDLPFLVVRTEHGSEDLDVEIAEEVRKRNCFRRSTPSIFTALQTDVRQIFIKTKILIVASAVDETFCRAAYEAMLNGIPVMTTGKGNIRNLVGDAGMYAEESDNTSWMKGLTKLYFDRALYMNLQTNAERKTALLSEQSVQRQFESMLKTVIRARCAASMIMLFTPWCDQGLGYQSKRYVEILHSRGFQTCIFAYLPYWNGSSSSRHQANQEEWKHPAIYYSPHEREKVLDREILDFVRLYQVSHCIIPETCWFRVFQIAQFLSSQGIRVLAVPNIETVRKAELLKHRVFTKILANNHFCQNHFQTFGFSNVEFIGYSLPSKFIRFEMTSPDSVNFLFLGGMNAFSRKQIVKVLQSFRDASAIVKDRRYSIHLTACVQIHQSCSEDERCLLKEFENDACVSIVVRHLSGADVESMYRSADITVLVSRHEGLGLGFYESICLGIPVITLDAEPHKEIIHHMVNGFIVPAKFVPMPDNDDALYGSAQFENCDLTQTFVTLGTDRSLVQDLFRRTREDYQQRFDTNSFANRFCTSVYKRT